MESFEREFVSGSRFLKTADHVLSITYPLVRDNKLLLVVMKNLFSAARSLTLSVLQYEKAFKRIPDFSDDSDSIAHWFRQECLPRYKLSNDYFFVFGELKALMDYHQESMIEFSRKNCLVICSENYELRRITLSELKNYVNLLKRMLGDVGRVVLSYEGVFGRVKGRAEAR